MTPTINLSYRVERGWPQTELVVVKRSNNTGYIELTKIGRRGKRHEPVRVEIWREDLDNLQRLFDTRVAAI